MAPAAYPIPNGRFVRVSIALASQIYVNLAQEGDVCSGNTDANTASLIQRVQARSSTVDAAVVNNDELDAALAERLGKSWKPKVNLKAVPPKVDVASKVGAPKVETPKAETAKVAVSAKVETPKASKAETAKAAVSAKVETPKAEIPNAELEPKVEIAQTKKSCVPPAATDMLKSLSKSSATMSKKIREAMEDKQLSALHAVVGSGGALQINLERKPERAKYASEKLAAVGIFATKIPATDASCIPGHLLEEACSSDCSPDEAAIAHSHKRALELASLRDEEWTAVFEDDAVPVLMGKMNASEWNSEFRRIWRKVPEAAKVVRLSWCLPDSDKWTLQWEKPTIGEAGEGKMMLTRFGMQSPDENIWHSVGLCTTAYMVRKDAIESLLNIFPCNGALDACLGWKYFNTWDEKTGSPGLEYLYNLDIEGSASYIRSTGDVSMKFFGIMMQARNQLESSVARRSR